jgi:predicted transcriptional regulator
MPVLEDVPKIVRGMVMKSIRSGVPATEQPHFLPVLDNEAEWKKVTRFRNPDDAYVVVVDGDGNIRWQISGKVSDSGFAALEQQIGAARGQMPKQ